VKVEVTLVIPAAQEILMAAKEVIPVIPKVQAVPEVAEVAEEIVPVVTQAVRVMVVIIK
jgi:hypothetical protein